MSTKLSIGNLDFKVTENDLHDTFAAYGTVVEANLATNRETGRLRGLAFIAMRSPEEAQKAIEGLNSKDMGGRALNVSIARPREERPGGGGGRRGDMAAAVGATVTSALNNGDSLHPDPPSPTALLGERAELGMSRNSIVSCTRLATFTSNWITNTSSLPPSPTRCASAECASPPATVSGWRCSPYDLDKARIVWKLK